MSNTASITEMPPSGRVARNVRAELARSETKQASLAAALGMTQGAVSHRLTGRTDFSINELVRIAAHLGVPLSTLLDGVEPAQASA